jgi:MFS family permease
MAKIKSLISRLIYGNQADLLYNKHKKDQDFFISQLVFSTAFLVLTGGSFLTGYALYLGASDTLAGYIPLLAGICGIFSIFAGIILERIEKRKRLIITLNIISKTLVASIVAIPCFFSGTTALIVLFAMLIAAYMTNSLMGIAINDLFISVVPESIRGRYYSIRQTFALIVSATLSIIAGRFLDSVTSKYVGFVIIYSVAFLMIWGEVISFSKIKEMPPGHIGKGNIKLLDIIRIPLHNKKFMLFVISVIWFYLGFYICAAYTQVFMIKYLNLSYTFITIMSMLLSIGKMFTYRVWGNVYDSKGASYTIKMAIWFYILEVAVWTFVSSYNKYALIPVTYIFEAIAFPGFIVGTFNMRFKLIPKNGRTIFDGFYTAIFGIILIIAPLIGRLIQTGIMSTNIPEVIPFAQFRLLYGITTIVLLSLQCYHYFSKNIKKWDE